MKSSLLLLAIFVSLNVSAQINVQLLHQLVEDSKEEHTKQMEAKDNQAKTAIREEINKNLLGQVKDGYKNIQERFAKMTIAFDALGIANGATPLVRSIIDNQQQIVFYCQRDPMLLPFALEAERVFVSQSYSLLNFLIGLAASIGDINQMQISDRRILFSHILNELKTINQLSFGTSRSLEALLRGRSGGNPYQDYVKEESQLVEEILSNIKILTK
jgi:hypothetical protein